MSKSLVILKISVTTNENELEEELKQNYDGVLKVTRLYSDDQCVEPMQAVQVDFNNRENMQKVLVKQNLVLHGICRPLSTLNNVRCTHCRKSDHQSFECPNSPLSEQDVIDFLNHQKNSLSLLLNNIEGKLNKIISGR